jgi:YggT family protein
MDFQLAYAETLYVVRVVVFWLAVVVAVLAVLDWSVRTRRVNPFSLIGRYTRRFIDPLMRPVERLVVRRGGLPANAPWWALGFVVVGGLLLLTLLNHLAGFFANVVFGLSSPARFGVMLLSWVFGLLKLAIAVRVISSWVRVSPYSKWVRWSFTLTEWLMAPLRRVIPPLGMVDVTPFVAYLLIVIVQRVVGVP